jgi:hypothetical protein
MLVSRFSHRRQTALAGGLRRYAGLMKFHVDVCAPRQLQRKLVSEDVVEIQRTIAV